MRSILTSLLISFFCAESRATTILPQSPAELVSQSTVIFRGLALSSQTVFDNGEVWTHTRLQVEDLLKGKASPIITVRQYGGVYGGIGYVIAGMPKPLPGERYLIFLDDLSSAVSPIAGFSQGFFAIEGDDLRDAYGNHVVWRGVSTPMRAARMPGQGPDAFSPVESYSSFRQRIAMLVDGSPFTSQSDSPLLDFPAGAGYSGIPVEGFTVLECGGGTGRKLLGRQSLPYNLVAYGLQESREPHQQWSQALAGIVGEWNSIISSLRIDLSFGLSRTSSRDGINSLEFSFTLDGQSWPANVVGIAKTYYLVSSCQIIETDIHLNQNRTFATDGRTDAVDFAVVAGHEIGHGLGLDHPDGLTDAAIMFSSIRVFAGHRVRVSDRRGIRYVYGGQAAVSYPDLVITLLRGPATGSVGGRIMLPEMVASNLGPGEAESILTYFYLSLDPTITSTDIRIGTGCLITAIFTAGMTTRCSPELTIPVTVPAGRYYLGAIVDANNVIREVNDENNSRLADPELIELDVRADLEIVALRSSTSATLGTLLAIPQLQVRNSGSGAASAFRVSVVLSTDSIITLSDINTSASCAFGQGLPVGVTGGCSLEVLLPSSLSPGTYFVGAIADSQNQIREIDENNNSRVADTGAVVLGRSTSPLIYEGGVVNGASFLGPGLTPGSISSLFGTRLVGSSGVTAAGGVPLPLNLSGVSVSINGIPTPLFAVASIAGEDQINFQTPWEVRGLASVSVVVNNGGVSSPPRVVPLITALPGIFVVGGNRGTVLHGSDSSLVTSSSPAKRQEIIVVYATGLGPVENTPLSGASLSEAQLSHTLLTVGATVGGRPAPVLFSGLAPGYVGLYQVNLEVPGSVFSGDQDLVLVVNERTSNTVKIAIE